MRLYLMLFALIIFSTIASCTSSVSGNGSQVGNPKVTGSVIDSLNSPIVKASIIMRPFDYTIKDSILENKIYLTTTDKYGNYEFVENLDTGNFVIEIIENDSVKAFVKKFKLDIYDSLNFNSVVEKTGSLKGIIKNSPYSNVYIMGLDAYSETDSVGSFTIDNIPDGTFNVLIENTHYDSLITIESLEIVSEESTDVGIVEFDTNNSPTNLMVLLPIGDTCFWDSFDNDKNLGKIKFQYSSEDLDLNDISLYMLYLGDDSLNLVKKYEGIDTSILLDSIKPGTKYYYKLFVTDLIDTQNITASFSTIQVSSSQSFICMKNQNFIMGSNNGDSDELVLHKVIFDYDILADKSEVYQSYYKQIMDSIYDTLIKVEWDTLFGKGDSFPAYYVNWYEAVLFCNAKSKIEGLDSCYTYKSINVIPDTGAVLDSVKFDFTSNGYRLPTEAEWEFMCKAFSETDYYWNDNNAIDYAIFGQSSSNKINSKIPNDYNLYDMSGNVWEWCNDFYDENYYSVSDSINPLGPSLGINKVIRGGSWSGDLHSIRTSDRFGYNPKTRVSDGGFRCVRKVN